MILPKKCTITLQQAVAQMTFNDWNKREDVIVLDTETTGLYDAEICEISVLDLGGKVLFDSLVKPANGIPMDATVIHGITNEDVENAPTWPQVWSQLYPIIKDKLILIYNADFDTRLMYESFYPYLDYEAEGHEELKQIRSLNTACVMRTYSDLVGAEKWLKLSEACGYDTKHRALDDCRATLDVVRKAYNPDFSQRDLEIVQWRDELERTSRRIRYLNHRIREITDEKNKLLEKQKQLLQRLVSDEAGEEVAASLEDPPTEISDEDLPF